jgi:SAM-dependent methyltransferase
MFFQYINAGSLASARVVCPLLVGWLKPESVLDVGCGAGAWCKIWRETGVADVLGVDGDYVDRAGLLIDQSEFRSQDLSRAFDLGRTFSLVVSLEVAEHVAVSSADTFVESLSRHGDVVLFSAAVPGQGGEFHVNEQPLRYWRERFAQQGFRCFDPLRPRILVQREVEPWYRYNTLLYARGASREGLPEAVLGSEIPEGAPIPELAPLSWRARNAVLGALPAPLVESLVKLKHAWVRRLGPA